jgi:hypothetical protein
VDVPFFFEATSQDLVTEEDGSKARVVNSEATPLRFYNDDLGLVGPLAEAFNGGFLGFTTRVQPEGTPPWWRSGASRTSSCPAA